MFSWSHKYSIEVDVPLQMAWDFYTNPNNWLKWEDRIDAFFLEGDFKPGAQIKAKIKNKPTHLLILITEVKPYHEYRSLVQVLFSRQESLSTFQEIAPGKTRITFQIYVMSFFTPFLKSTLIKRVEQSHSKCMEAFTELSQQNCQ